MLRTEDLSAPSLPSLNNAQINMRNHILRPSEPAYTHIVDEENADLPSKKSCCSAFFSPSRLLIPVLLVLLAVCGYSHWMLGIFQSRTSALDVYRVVSTRREWRTLTLLERHEYLDAVRCLKTRPSRLGLNHTLYDDFPWIHYHVGEYGELHLCVEYR
jgi:hypothetical protein